MFDNWPNNEELKTVGAEPHESYIVAAAKSNYPYPAVYNLSVPTLLGNFGVSSSAFGLSLLFFPGGDEFELLDRMGKYNMAFGSWGRKRAIEAGLDLMGYLLGEVEQLSVPVDLSYLSPFQQDVYSALSTIGFGQTITYGELAALAGHKGKARAVGTVLKYNPAPIFIPCHRVLPSAGGLGGWSGPQGWKEWLLDHEGIAIDGLKSNTSLKQRHIP